LVVQVGDDVRLYEFPGEEVAEVEMSHPEHPWFAELGLRWYALPVVSHLRLSIGGVSYSAAPFNGFYVGDEIGSRDFGDVERYDMAPEVARRLGLDVTSDRTLWRERALVELNRAVLHSFDSAGIIVTDPHAEARRFLHFVDDEERAGREVHSDWTWVNSHLAPSQTETFFRYFDPTEHDPNLHLDPATKARALGCPAGEAPPSSCPMG
jgi:nitric-oxide synthase